MQTSANRPTHEQKDHAYLNVILILSWAIFFVPHYVIAGIDLVIEPSTIPESWLPVLLPIGAWAFYLSVLFFNKAHAYILISLLIATSGIGAFIWGHRALPLRLGSALGVLSVMALPWLFPAYQPALVAAPGIEMQFVTQPSNAVFGFVKTAQNSSEEVPCEYNLLGWSAENHLYYQSECEGETQRWFVNPYQPNEQGDIEALPSELYQEDVTKSDVLEMVRAEGVRPKSAEPSLRKIKLLEGSLRSPDGEWIAIVSQYTYGPQDVVLLSQAKE